MKKFFIILSVVLILFGICSCQPITKTKYPGCGCDLRVESLNIYNIDTMEYIKYAPTCTREGAYTIRCYKCGASLSEIKIPIARTHRYKALGGNTKHAICIDCGEGVVGYRELSYNSFEAGDVVYTQKGHQVLGYYYYNDDGTTAKEADEFLLKMGINPLYVNGSVYYYYPEDPHY